MSQVCTGTGYCGVGNRYAVRELHLIVRRLGLSGSPSGGCHYKGWATKLKGICKAFEHSLSYITYNVYRFRTQIYADLRRKLFPQIIKFINSIEDSNNLLRQLNRILKILIICVYLRTIIKTSLFPSRNQPMRYLKLVKDSCHYKIHQVHYGLGQMIKSSHWW